MDATEQQRAKHPVRTFFRFLAYLRPHQRRLALVLLCSFVAKPLGLIPSLAQKYIIDNVLLDVSDTVRARLFLMALFAAIWFAALWSSRLLDTIRGFYQLMIAMHIMKTLRKKFYRHLHRLPFEFFQGRPIGEHMYRCIEDIRADADPSKVFDPYETPRGLVDLAAYTIPRLFDTFCTFFWASLAVTMLSPMILIVMLALMIPNAIVNFIMITYVKKAYASMKGEDQLATAVMRDSVAGVETVKGYGRSGFMALEYVHQLHRAIRMALRRDMLTVTNWDLVSWIFQLLAYGGVWTILMWQLMVGEITVGSFYVLFGFAILLNQPIEHLIMIWMHVRQQLVPAERVLETLDIEPAIQDPDHPDRLPEFAKEIVFQNISFAYNPEVPVLRDVSLSVRAGETVGIVGRSGSGKSTILNLLLRFYRPQHGRILIDGHDLNDIQLSDWQAQYGIVLQDTFIFGGDIAYNVRYGKLDATEEEIRHALDMADAMEFIDEMPGGIHSELREGAILSGGQKQRIGIARAMVRKPKLLILDEPTSSLDSRTESEIWRSFERVMANCSAIIISHRLSTVRRADRILVMADGRIAESGAHDELLALGGIYTRMWREQNEGRANG